MAAEKQTASSLLIKILEDNPDAIEDIVVVWRTVDGWIKWDSNTVTPMAVGLLECGKQYVMEGYTMGKDFDSPDDDDDEDGK
jgi:hypothetical protein